MNMNLYRHPKYRTYSIRMPRSDRYPNGKLISLRKIVGHSVKNSDEANKIFKVLLKNNLEKKIEQLSGVSRIRILELSNQYRTDTDRATLSPATLRMDKLALETLADCITDKPVAAVNRRDFKKLKMVLMARGLSHYTINTYRRHIMAAFEYARENDYITKVPKFKPVKTSEHIPRILTKKEIKKIIRHAEKKDYEMARIIKFAIWTGCRRTEILSLQHQDINNDIAVITGKGDKQAVVRLLPGALAAIGKRFDIGPVFYQWHKDTISHRFKKIALDVKINDIHFHNLRHSAATYMIESGMHPKSVQAAMRHADFRTTEKYINIRNQFMFDEMEKFKI